MLSLKQWLYAGIGAILVGFLGAVGMDIYFAGKEAVVSIAGLDIPVHLMIFGAIAVAGLVILTLVLWETRKEKTTIDPRFVHLTIWYSQRTDTPDTEHPARPHYVAYDKTKQAYRISTWLSPFVKKRKFNWHTRDDGEALRKYFADHGITINDRDPLPEELGLKFDTKGKLVPLDEEKNKEQ